MMQIPNPSLIHNLRATPGLVRRGGKTGGKSPLAGTGSSCFYCQLCSPSAFSSASLTRPPGCTWVLGNLRARTRGPFSCSWDLREGLDKQDTQTRGEQKGTRQPQKKHSGVSKAPSKWQSSYEQFEAGRLEFSRTIMLLDPQRATPIKLKVGDAGAPCVFS